MSGHSKWSKIKRQKAVSDVKKSKYFSKAAALIAVAAREKGGDPSTNPALRLVIEKAKALNMPSDNIERAIKRGTGEIEDVKIEEITYEAYGPGGTALLIKTNTDNKNRTVSEIKHILNQRGGKFAEAGSVKWLFEEKGVISVNAKESGIGKDELELLAIDLGAEDIKTKEDDVEIYGKPSSLIKIKEGLEKTGIKIESAETELTAKNPFEIRDPKIQEELNKLYEALDDQNDVEEIYSNTAD